MAGKNDGTVLSSRLSLVADMIPRGSNVADIGTDHGFLPVYLVKHGIAKKVIACDIRKDPLSRAVKNAAEAGVSDMIDFRLSDGLDAVGKDEAGVYVICGMGGFVIMGILESAIEKGKIFPGTEFIMSPHCDEEVFRRYLYKNGFFIKSENMICDNGMFYVIFSCVYDSQEREASEQEYRYGAMPLKEKQSALKEYLLREKRILEETKEKLACSLERSENARRRLDDIEKELRMNSDALRDF